MRFIDDSKNVTKNNGIGPAPKKLGSSSASVASSSSIVSGASGLHGHKLKPIASDLATTLEDGVL